MVLNVIVKLNKNRSTVSLSTSRGLSKYALLSWLSSGTALAFVPSALHVVIWCSSYRKYPIKRIQRATGKWFCRCRRDENNSYSSRCFVRIRCFLVLGLRHWVLISTPLPSEQHCNRPPAPLRLPNYLRTHYIMIFSLHSTYSSQDAATYIVPIATARKLRNWEILETAKRLPSLGLVQNKSFSLQIGVYASVYSKSK
jgi:hypothetical protein